MPREGCLVEVALQTDSKGRDGANAVIEGGPGRRKGITQAPKRETGTSFGKTKLSSFVGDMRAVLLALVYP